MALRKILTKGDEQLAKHCRPVEKFDDRLHVLIDDMRETLENSGGVGLAAPQVGILRRVVVLLDVNKDPEEMVELVNPEVIEQRGADAAYTEDGEHFIDLPGDTTVSMNFWGFMPSIFPALRKYFEDFLRGLPADAVKAECLLPVMVGEELKAGRMTVSVLSSKDKWFGMTYHEDRALVAEDLQKLHAAGIYPTSLRD